MNKIRSYFSLALTICLTILLHSCAFTSGFTIQAEEEKTNGRNRDNMLINETKRGQVLPISAQLVIDGQIIDLEVASTPKQQQIGLMYRNFLSDDRGMLFPFPEPRIASFWMKNVNIPLDLIFMKDGVVKSIAHNVPPCQKDPCPVYYSETSVNQVLELAGGRAKQLNIQPGDHLEINLLHLDTKN